MGSPGPDLSLSCTLQPVMELILQVPLSQEEEIESGQKRPNLRRLSDNEGTIEYGVLGDRSRRDVMETKEERYQNKKRRKEKRKQGGA